MNTGLQDQLAQQQFHLTQSQAIIVEKEAVIGQLTAAKDALAARLEEASQTAVTTAAEHDEILQRETSKFNDWLAGKDGEIKEKNEAMDSLKVRNF